MQIDSLFNYDKVCPSYKKMPPSGFGPRSIAFKFDVITLTQYNPGFCHSLFLFLFLILLYSVDLIGMALSFIRSYKKAMKIVEIPFWGFSRNFGYFDASAFSITTGSIS